MKWVQVALFVAGVLARHESPRHIHEHELGQRYPALARRQDIIDNSLDTCPPVEDITVAIQPVSYTYFFPFNTIVDPLLNGRLLTITNAPIEITITGFLTVTRAPSRTTTTTTRRTTVAATTTRAPAVTTRASITTPRTTTVSSSRRSSSSSSAANSPSRSPSSSTTITTTVRTTTTTSSTVKTYSINSASPSPPPNGTYFISSTILVIARNAQDASQASSGLNGYGIPFEVLSVPQTGVASLPTLNSTFGGNYGGIIIVGQVSYNYDGIFNSALTTAQYQQLYDYQVQYGVRMVQYDVYPGPAFGATALGGCCTTVQEQYIYFTQTTPQSGLRTNANLSTAGLYHYIGQVTDPLTTTEIARYDPSGTTPGGTAAVINNFNGREQMVFFISWATDFSQTSNVLQHEFITWMTRGLYTGYRRVYFQTQIDDMFLSTPIYPTNLVEYRLVPADMQDIWNWVPTIQAQQNPGSFYLPEIGHNGNGNIDYSTYQVDGGDTICFPGSIQYDDQPATPLEFRKPLGTGRNYWPTSPTVYGFSTTCSQLDPLYNWFRQTANQNRFMHISHTFTHLTLNNATYSDALKEIQFNQAWLQEIGFASGRFTPNGLIPPAITGLHNGDVMRAWTDAGLRNCVGDNTRPALRNPQNPMWPYTSNFATDGFDGYNVIPRWATRIYYNCDTPECTTLEWINTSAGQGTFFELLTAERTDTMRHLFGLFHDGYMFHQANLRTQALPAITINGVSSRISIFQAWVETMVQEFGRLATWPMITLSQAELATTFINRQTRDRCAPNLSWTRTGNQITGVTVTCNNFNICDVPIPVTLPLGVTTNTQGYQTEQIGNDPLTIWVPLQGSSVSFVFNSPLNT